MKVVITGATGNVGTSVLEALADEQRVQEIVGIARRFPEREFPRTRFLAADVVESDLAEIFPGADAVVHLAWLIQPGRDESVTYRTILGAGRVGADRRGVDDRTHAGGGRRR